jgi:hypothetical protein
MNLEDIDALDKKFQKDLMPVLPPDLLCILSRATEPMYGYQIATMVKVESYSISRARFTGTQIWTARLLEAS